jgi:DNA-binding NarL/FixJ family response regulator
MARSALRVLVAEDNDDLRDMLVRMLAFEDDLECAGSVRDVPSLLSEAALLAPDVLLVDLELGGESALAAISELRRSFPVLGIVVHSGHARPDFVQRVRAATGGDYVVKNGDFTALFAALRRSAGAS